jgi:hypothetical protein
MNRCQISRTNEDRDSQIEFMRINGARIAACAWNCYRENGRGHDLRFERSSQRGFAAGAARS